MKLLHLDSSIQGDASVSRTISAAVVRHFRDAGAVLDYRYRDLVADPLAHLTLDLIGTAEARAVLADFQAADVVVIGTAMYNFTIPTQLKAWIDRILVAGETFRYTAQGADGLAGGKCIVIALARGGLYGEGSAAAAFEHAQTYLGAVFGFIGITDQHVVLADGLGLGEDIKTAALQSALDDARRLVERLIRR